MQGTFFRGTTHTQDARFSDKEKKLMQTMSFDEILEKKVDLKKVDLGVFEPWVEQQVTKILGIDDEVIPAMIISELETYKQENKNPNGKLIQIRVTGFLERDAKKFMVDLWKLLLEAQDSQHGIPTSLINQKKIELKAREEELKKNVQSLKKLDEVKQQLKSDLQKLKEINRLFTDRSSSVERKPVEKQSTSIDSQKLEDLKRGNKEKRHNQSLKKFEEDEYLDKKKDNKNSDMKKETRRNASSSSDSIGKRDRIKKDSHKDKKHRDNSDERRDYKSSNKDKHQKDDYQYKDKKQKSKRDRSRSRSNK